MFIVNVNSRNPSLELTKKSQFIRNGKIPRNPNKLQKYYNIQACVLNLEVAFE